MAFLAPIPVGHRVEVRVYLVDTAVFSTHLEPAYQAPLVIDHDAGIVYGHGWHFEPITTYTAGAVRPELPMGPRPDLTEHARWFGKVTANRVAWIGNGQAAYHQTTLVIQPEAHGTVYR
jgi:hypothetical protein